MFLNVDFIIIYVHVLLLEKVGNSVVLFTCRHGRYDVKTDARAASTLPKYGHPLGVATERADVLVHELEREKLIQHGEVRGHGVISSSHEACLNSFNQYVRVFFYKYYETQKTKQQIRLNKVLNNKQR